MHLIMNSESSFLSTRSCCSGYFATRTSSIEERIAGMLILSCDTKYFEDSEPGINECVRYLVDLCFDRDYVTVSYMNLLRRYMMSLRPFVLTVETIVSQPERYCYGFVEHHLSQLPLAYDVILKHREAYLDPEISTYRLHVLPTLEVQYIQPSQIVGGKWDLPCPTNCNLFTILPASRNRNGLHLEGIRVIEWPDEATKPARVVQNPVLDREKMGMKFIVNCLRKRQYGLLPLLMASRALLRDLKDMADGDRSRADVALLVPGVSIDYIQHTTQRLHDELAEELGM